MKYEESKEIMEAVYNAIASTGQITEATISGRLAFKKSIEALDKQIPKAIEYNNDNLSICPCGLHVHTYDKYCRYCGQAIYYDINKE